MLEFQLCDSKVDIRTQETCVYFQNQDSLLKNVNRVEDFASSPHLHLFIKFWELISGQISPEVVNSSI
jgi:hypothetical protein